MIRSSPRIQKTQWGLCSWLTSYILIHNVTSMTDRYKILVSSPLISGARYQIKFSNSVFQPFLKMAAIKAEESHFITYKVVILYFLLQYFSNVMVLASEGCTTHYVVWMLNVVVIVTEIVGKRLWLVQKRTMLVWHPIRWGPWLHWHLYAVFCSLDINQMVFKLRYSKKWIIHFSSTGMYAVFGCGDNFEMQ